ncbi:MAG: YfcE family phosphodiesterase [Bacteroidales bacterium]|nr:YfcE family phosphodiesterase [Bacteroidales bacterium]
MKILCFTDIHGTTGNFDKISDEIRLVDAVLLAGDISHFGHRSEVALILDKLLRLNPSVYAVSGNCDYPDVDEYLSEINISINNTIKKLDHFFIYGLSGSLPCPGRTPNEKTEINFQEIISSSKSRFKTKDNLIFVTHQPPYNTKNDEVAKGIHVGSKSIRILIEEVQPLLCLAGHIHEGIGIDEIGRTKIINPGPFKDGNFAYAELGANSINVLEIKHV